MIPDVVSAWAGSPVGGVVVVALGWWLGRLLARAADAWYRATEDLPVTPRFAATVSAGAACLAGLLWWWEVRLTGATAPGSGAAAVVRCLAHMALLWLLAAATWIDFRQRVIPDWITVPGVIVGLATAWAWPQSLLPITVEVSRTYSVPVEEGDVLAWYGGLHAGVGGMCGGSPMLPGLCLALAIFTAWWLVCTEPMHDARGGFRLSSRNALVVVGWLAIAAAWWGGGQRFDALQSVLVGMAVSGGLVWAVRAGASAALGREAMGLGDVTLMAMVGSWLGWQPCVLTFFLAAFIGLGHGLLQVIRHQEHELPFGPSLCLAAGVVVVAWQPLWHATRIHFERPGQLAAVVAAVVVLTAITLAGWRWLGRAG